jgi:large subunit ribosomal protein L23
MTHAGEIIQRPIITEKSARSLTENKYMFVVNPSVNKHEIAEAVEQLFGVEVLRVCTHVQRGKRLRVRVPGSKKMAKRSDFKKAVVTLKHGDTIEIFPKSEGGSK